MSDLKIEYLGDLRRLDVKPGDIFILNVDEHLSEHQMKCLNDLWVEQMGNVKVLIFTKGITLGVVRNEAA